jgi:hypothetical protein
MHKPALWLVMLSVWLPCIIGYSQQALSLRLKSLSCSSNGAAEINLGTVSPVRQADPFGKDSPGIPSLFRISLDRLVSSQPDLSSTPSVVSNNLLALHKTYASPRTANTAQRHDRTLSYSTSLYIQSAYSLYIHKNYIDFLNNITPYVLSCSFQFSTFAISPFDFKAPQTQKQQTCSAVLPDASLTIGKTNRQDFLTRVIAVASKANDAHALIFEPHAQS